jgi:UDP-N-acetyl-D-galactosamine dehydrogenase
MSNITENEKLVCVIGLGYVGLPLAIELSEVYKTTGYDINKKRIDQLKKFNDTTNEVDPSRIETSKINFTNSATKIADYDYYIVTVPTPVDSTDSPNLDPLKNATKLIGESMKEGSIVIYESTVFPGCTEEVCVPILEEHSGMKFNKDFFVGYSPERINPADKENTIRTIKKIVSGSSEASLELINNLYSRIIDAGTHQVSSIKVAEAAKIIENTQRDINIALMNEFSIILDKVGIDTLEVLEAAETKWNFLPFRPGLVGGHCIGVDPYYLTYKARLLDYHPEVILSGRRINDSMTNHIFDKICSVIRDERKKTSFKVGFFGLTFKENCPDTRNSKSLELFNKLKSLNIDLLVNDPHITQDDANASNISLTSLHDMTELDIAIFAVGHREYRELSVKQISSFFGETKILFDIKSIYDLDMCKIASMNVFRL